MRKLAGPGITILLGFGATVMGWTHFWVGAGLLAVAVVWAGLVFTPLVNYIPTIELARGGKGEGISLHLRPPAGSLHRRLRRDTDHVVQKMHDYYLQARPSFLAADETHRAMMRAATTDEERSAIWAENIREMRERSERERQELAQSIGADVRCLLNEYQRLNLIDSTEARHIEWKTHSSSRLEEAAVDLGALARRL